MPTSVEFPYPRRYNSLRLLGFDYGSTSALYFLTIDTDSSRPVFGDITSPKRSSVRFCIVKLGKDSSVGIYAIADHLHLLAGVRRKKL
jgi:hypothetical protein